MTTEQIVGPYLGICLVAAVNEEYVLYPYSIVCILYPWNLLEVNITNIRAN
jgi:hypothetical protein